jgi:hypothetical protein
LGRCGASVAEERIVNVHRHGQGLRAPDRAPIDVALAEERPANTGKRRFYLRGLPGAFVTARSSSGNSAPSEGSHCG